MGRIDLASIDKDFFKYILFIPSFYECPLSLPPRIAEMGQSLGFLSFPVLMEEWLPPRSGSNSRKREMNKELHFFFIRRGHRRLFLLVLITRLCPKVFSPPTPELKKGHGNCLAPVVFSRLFVLSRLSTAVCQSTRLSKSHFFSLVNFAF